ncbi:MAG TPA: cytochrome ubiquinol oxidase subunit I, partial [Candidatus Hydrogenedentes bacterium]|nr:cytochrome ubiquinol oxidase subunit I [Candidatus Hydrogenedentota bacterium]
MHLDPVLLSRIQFAMTVGFHFIFPPLSIGLAYFLVLVEWRAWRRNDPVYERMGRFFAKFLALTFALGVATGITMEFQFGT